MSEYVPLKMAKCPNCGKELGPSISPHDNHWYCRNQYCPYLLEYGNNYSKIPDGVWEIDDA